MMYSLLFLAACANAEWAETRFENRFTYKVQLDNLSFRQPLGGIFVMVHRPDSTPLFRFNEKASPELAILAEDGNPQPLVDLFARAKGVKSSFSVAGPVLFGQSTNFTAEIPEGYVLTLATMAINTNDCYVALNGVKVYDGSILDMDGLDAGTEENNELCSFIPGPACPAGGDNLRAEPREGDEGFVHVHRGFHGINEGKVIAKKDLGASGFPLSAVRYDWRNPMARVTIYKM